MKVIDKAGAEKFRKLLKGARDIVLTTHSHPDGDAVGSVVALALYIRSISPARVSPIFPDPIPDNIAFITEGTEGILVHASDHLEAECRIANCDLIICLDFGNFGRTGGMEQALNQAGAFKLLVDHHPMPEMESFGMVFSRTDVSSASELLFWLLLSIPDTDGDASKLPAATRDALMAGMTTDTNNFSNSVFPSTLKMASLLMATGTDRDSIVHRLFNEYRENRLRLMGWMLSEGLLILDDVGAAVMALDSATMIRFGVMEGETEGFVNLPLTVKKVRLSLFLREYDDCFRVSLRSKKGVSANACAMTWFNGGGHENAAGGKIYKAEGMTTIKDAVAYSKVALVKFFGK